MLAPFSLISIGSRLKCPLSEQRSITWNHVLTPASLPEGVTHSSTSQHLCFVFRLVDLENEIWDRKWLSGTHWSTSLRSVPSGFNAQRLYLKNGLYISLTWEVLLIFLADFIIFDRVISVISSSFRLLWERICYWCYRSLYSSLFRYILWLFLFPSFVITLSHKLVALTFLPRYQIKHSFIYLYLKC